MHRWHALFFLILPSFLALCLWQVDREFVVRPADLRSFDQIVGFNAAETGSHGLFRWSSPEAHLLLPTRGTPALFQMRAAVAPEASVRFKLGDAPPISLTTAETAPQLRKYTLITPVATDAVGWLRLSIYADPARLIDSRKLGLAVFDINIQPLGRGLQFPPLAAWLILTFLPMGLAALLVLARVPLTTASGLAAAAGTSLVVLWAMRPDLMGSPLRDLQAFFDPVVLIWWFTIQAIGLSALPLTGLALRALPLAGYPLAKVMGLLLLTLVVWVIALSGLLPFGLPLILGAWLAMGIAGMAIWWWIQRQGIRLGWPGWRAVVGWELLFSSALFVGCMLRWHSPSGPAITGNEKPMNLMILSAVLRYDQLPPSSPWFAGYDFNYYYLGYVTVGLIARLTGTTAAYAFNIGFALIVALIVVGLAYLGLVLARLTALPTRHPWRQASIGALLALLLVLPLGSQAAALQLSLGTHSWWVLDVDQLGEAFRQRLAGAEELTLSRPTVEGRRQPPRTTIETYPWPSFDWKRSWRIIYDDIQLPDGRVERQPAITEFPALSLYLGDLHPHTMVIPFSLLALSLALALVAGGPTPARAALAGVVVGALYCINSWDAPTYALLCAGAIMLGSWRMQRARLHVAVPLALLSFIVAAGLVVLPFALTFSAPAGSVADEVLKTIPGLSRLSTIIGLSEHRTRLHSFLVMFGLFLLPIFVAAARGTGLRLLTWAVPLTLLGGVLVGFPLLFLIPLACLLVLRAYRAETPGLAMACWIAAVGALVLFVPEVVYIRDHQEQSMYRSNMIFKFYYQVWFIWGLAAAYAVWWLLQAQRLRLRDLAWIAPLIMLVAGASVFPFGLSRWTEASQQGERSLDGLAFLARSAPDELAAAQWLATHVAPEERMVNGFSHSMTETLNRPAAISGVQSLLGLLHGHEELWRSGIPEQLAVMAERERDIPLLYTTSRPELIAELLERHQVSYIYFGPLERELYGDASRSTFAVHFPLVFKQGEFEIFQVTRESIGALNRVDQP
jgi:YYY domain-containing protein